MNVGRGCKVAGRLHLPYFLRLLAASSFGLLHLSNSSSFWPQLDINICDAAFIRQTEKLTKYQVTSVVVPAAVDFSTVWPDHPRTYLPTVKQEVCLVFTFWVALRLLRQSHNLQWFIINVKINFRMPLLVFITPAHGLVFLCAVVTCKLMTRFIASGCRHVGFYCSNLCSLQTIPSTQFHLVCMSCVDMHLQRNVKVASLQDSGLSNRNHYHRQQRVISTSPPPKQSKSGWISAVFGEQIRTGSADEFHIDHFWSLPGFWAMRSVM